jgi:adenosylhomocysteine nucleosidase
MDPVRSYLAMKLGIVGAMRQETALLQGDLKNVRRQTRGVREYSEGTLYGKDVVLVFSGWAKVAAASTVTTLIDVFGVDLIIFTGVAGAADPALQVGDIVIGDMLVQHDLDPRPLFGRFEVPLLDRVAFEVPPNILALARKSVELFLERDLRDDLSPDVLSRFRINSTPKLYQGLIVSGDQFIADPAVLARIRAALIDAGLPSPLCVEMEGAAVAQVCYEHDIPVIVARTISDKADHSAAVDFIPFIDTIASHFTRGIIREFVANV